MPENGWTTITVKNETKKKFMNQAHGFTENEKLDNLIEENLPQMDYKERLSTYYIKLITDPNALE